ncbi:MAG TPA: helix-turn-helix domain-containing protein [Rhizomicrobium sp.]|nr:helix-turn-helix domain-containing protein [Rhizomicrobium sp.]
MDDKSFKNKRGGPFLNTIHAAEFLKLSPRTLENMRRTGEGPPFHKHGSRVFYTIPELVIWSNARLMTSTDGKPSFDPHEPSK